MRWEPTLGSCAPGAPRLGARGGAAPGFTTTPCALPVTAGTRGPRGRAESSAAPLSLCYAPSPSTTLHFLVHWRVKERSGRKEAQQTQVRRVSSPARGVVAPRSSSDGSLLLIVRMRADRSGAGEASGTTRSGRLSKSVAKALRGAIGREKKRGISTILLARSGAIGAFATDLDNRPPGRGR